MTMAIDKFYGMLNNIHGRILTNAPFNHFIMHMDLKLIKMNSR